MTPRPPFPSNLPGSHDPLSSRQNRDTRARSQLFFVDFATRIVDRGIIQHLHTVTFFFLFFILRRMGKNKALAHHTSTYFHTRLLLLCSLRVPPSYEVTMLRIESISFRFMTFCVRLQKQKRGKALLINVRRQSSMHRVQRPHSTSGCERNKNIKREQEVGG